MIYKKRAEAANCTIFEIPYNSNVIPLIGNLGGGCYLVAKKRDGKRSTLG